MALDADCDDAYLPEAEANFCAPDFNFGSLGRLFFAVVGTTLTDVEDLAEWEAAILNEDADPLNPDLTKIRYLNITGGKPAAERSEVDLSRGRKVYPKPDHTYNVVVDETSMTNYKLLQQLEQNGGQFACWIEHGKYLDGGNAGIIGTIILDDIIPDDENALETFAGTVKFTGYHPDRNLSPFV